METSTRALIETENNAAAIAALAKKIALSRDSAAENAAAIATLNSKADELSALTAELSTLTAKLSTKEGTLRTDVNSLKTRMQSAETAIDANKIKYERIVGTACDNKTTFGTFDIKRDTVVFAFSSANISIRFCYGAQILFSRRSPAMYIVPAGEGELYVPTASYSFEIILIGDYERISE